jgi:hypothetical protein
MQIVTVGKRGEKPAVGPPGIAKQYGVIHNARLSDDQPLRQSSGTKFGEESFPEPGRTDQDLPATGIAPGSQN